MFSLICVWINGWINNREAGDSRRHRAHYAVTEMTMLQNHPHMLIAYINFRFMNLYPISHYHRISGFHQTLLSIYSYNCHWFVTRVTTFSNFSKQGFCSCDKRCRILGDCCGDAPRECFGARNDHVSNLLPNDEGDMVEFENIRSNELPIWGGGY